MDDQSAPASAPTELSRMRSGQRRVNLIWEATQAVIAVSVIGTTLAVDRGIAMNGLSRTEISSSALMQLNVMAALVTGFYFGRTNHEHSGGIGDRQGPR